MTSPVASPPKVDDWIVRLFGNDRPLGFEAGDANLYRYAKNNHTNATDPSGLDPPGSHTVNLGGDRGTVFVEWFPGVKAEFAVFDSQGRPVERFIWMANNPNVITSTFDHGGENLPGIRPNFMRRISLGLVNQFRIGIERAQGTWNRNLIPARVRAGFPLQTLGIYLSLRDACQMAGVVNPDQTPINEPYYFTATDGSIFILQRSGSGRRFVDGVASVLSFGLVDTSSPPQRVFVAGPRLGQSEDITDAQYEEYREEGERLYGRYIPGGLFGQSRFIPGTERLTLPLYERDLHGALRLVGHIDETGEHRLPASQLRLPGLLDGV